MNILSAATETREGSGNSRCRYIRRQEEREVVPGLPPQHRTLSQDGVPPRPKEEVQESETRRRRGPLGGAVRRVGLRLYSHLVEGLMQTRLFRYVCDISFLLTLLVIAFHRLSFSKPHFCSPVCTLLSPAGLTCEVGLRTRSYHVLTGSVLSVWNKVEMAIASSPGAHNNKMQVIRLRTDSGQRIVGKILTLKV